MTAVKVRNHRWLLDDAATGHGHCLLEGQRCGPAWGRRRVVGSRKDASKLKNPKEIWLRHKEPKRHAAPATTILLHLLNALGRRRDLSGKSLLRNMRTTSRGDALCINVTRT